MHIRELRIAGFKSFVDPENVPINQGLTGIVGPNGCGKSNLLEALRWAMGANSARAMRGGEMDDLIFSGAAGRPARELAEVTLVLDNTARTAPPEFNGADTLEVMRRLKRGAGSTYKLNGRTVRGKDIKLLFADASTGANSPSLVRQGQISELIASNPQNRRRILEEAAGIAGLNTRRHDAELKLRAAETNLERLSEVSAEVERQLESLKRQARKARKYKELSRQITGLEAFLAHLKWQTAKSDHAQASEALETAKVEVERVTREAAVTETKRIEVSDDIQPLRNAESIASGKLGQARIELARLETERKNASDALSRLEGEANRIAADIAREQAQKEEAETTLSEARDSLAALPVADDAVNSEMQTAAEQALSAARETLNVAQAKADAASSELTTKRAEIQAARANVDAHEKRKCRLEREVATVESDLAGLPDTSEQLQALADARQKEADASASLQHAEQRLEAAEQAVIEAQKQEANAHGPAKEAEDQLRTLETEMAGLRRLLRKADGPMAPPIIDRIKTHDGYEKAVAAALGDGLQAPTDRTAAMYWAGREADAQTLPTGATPLARYIEAPGELAGRLSQCGVVDASAGAAMASMLKPGQRLVSVEGHLWRWDGFHRTPEAPLGAAERLEQQARLDTIGTQVEPAKQVLESCRRTLELARHAKQTADTEHKAARQHLSQVSGELSNARRARATAEQDADRASLKADGLKETLSRLQADLQIATEALETVAQPGQTSDLALLETAVETTREALTAARNAETEARGRLTDLTRNRQQAMARRSSLESDVERWIKRVEAGGERVNTLIARRHEIATDTKAAKQKPDTLQSEIAVLAERVETLEAERKTAADTLAQREAEIREIEMIARTAAKNAMSARETLATTKARLENAAERFEEAVEISRTQFSRAPEGLLSLATDVLTAEQIETLEIREAERQLDFLRRDREQLGGVNMDAESEAEELASRLGVQEDEKADLVGAIAKLREGIAALNSEGRNRLMAAFETVNGHFKTLFTTLFRGGEAELRLVNADDPLEAGLEIFAQPPGKRLGTLSLMSGGEQALTATALIFAVFLSRPSPICVLDEVDAPLDDANVDRYCRMLDEMRQRTDTRFIVITHNPVTMSRMDRLFGVTMREKGVSKLVSVDLEAAEELVAA